MDPSVQSADINGRGPRISSPPKPSSGPDDFPDHLAKHLEKTGFPHEIRTAKLIEEAGWHLMPNQPYVDSESGKTREVDLYAYYPPQPDTDSGATLYPELLVECKKSKDYSLVVFKRHAAYTFEDIETLIIDPPFLLGRNLDPEFTPSGLGRGLAPFVSDILHFKTKDASSTYSMQKLGSFKSRSVVYGAAMTLMKALGVLRERRLEEVKSWFFPTFPIGITFLAIAFDGRIFEATTKNGAVKLRESDHSVIRVPHHVREFRRPVFHMIDVVTPQCFDEYLRVLREDIARIQALLERDDIVDYLTV